MKNEAGLDEDFVAFRQHDQLQDHVAGGAGIVEIEGDTGGGEGDLSKYVICYDFNPTKYLYRFCHHFLNFVYTPIKRAMVVYHSTISETRW